MSANSTQVILLGTGSVIPNPRRTATSHLLLTAEERVLVDCGPGSAHRMAESGFLPKDLSRILITHLHADHCSELPSIALSAFLQGRETALPVYGPKGTEAHVNLLFNQVFGYIPRLLANNGKKFEVEVHEVDPGNVLENDQLKIDCAKVIHGPIFALGYRINTAHGHVGFSGDTAPCEDLIDLVKDVHLLIHECPYPDKHGPHPAHTIPNQLGPIADKTQAKALAMNHFFPMCDSSREDMIESVGQSYKGDIIFGEDLMTITVKE
jgi:ribonuclease Z